MVGDGLQSVRRALAIVYAETYVTAEEFVLLYDYNRSKPVFP